MQDKIRSKCTDWELMALSDENQIYRCFELIGIYMFYNNMELSKGNLDKFYIKCVNEKKYCYINEGVREIHKLLEENYHGYRGIYNISKRSMRQYGITYKGKPVVVYEGTFVVLELMLRYILDNDDIRSLYYRHIHNREIEKYLKFQYECLMNFICAGETTRQIYYRENVKVRIEQLLERV